MTTATAEAPRGAKTPAPQTRATWLKGALHSKGLSAHRAASASGLSSATYYSISRPDHRRAPPNRPARTHAKTCTWSTVGKLAAFFGVDQDWLAGLSPRVFPPEPPESARGKRIQAASERAHPRAPRPGAYSTFRDWLQAALKARGLTAEQASRRAGLAAQTVAGLLSRDRAPGQPREPRSATVGRLAAYFRVEPHALRELISRSRSAAGGAPAAPARLRPTVRLSYPGHGLAPHRERAPRLNAEIRAALGADPRSARQIALAAGIPSLRPVYRLLSDVEAAPSPAYARALGTVLGVDPDRWEALAALDGPTTLACEQCGHQVSVNRARSQRRRFCSQRCKAETARQYVPWNSVQQTIRARCAAEGLTLGAYADRAGVPRSALRAWFRAKDRSIKRAYLERLATDLGLGTADEVARLPGVRITEEVQAELGRGLSARPGARVMKHGRAPGARRPKPEQVAAWVRTRNTVVDENGLTAAERFQRASANAARTTKGRALRMLKGRLRFRNPHPSAEEVGQWADETTTALGLTRRAVLGLWHPYLVRRGLVGTAGRPADVARCQRIRTHLDHDGITPETPRAPYGFWKASANAEPDEDSARPDGPAQLGFWRRHICSACSEDRRLRRNNVA